MKKFIIKLIFNDYQIALINESIKDKIVEKFKTGNETLIQDSIELNKINRNFQTKFNLYQ